MRNLTINQIKQVKSLEFYQYNHRLHGNTKVVGNLPVDLYRSILLKKWNRQFISPKDYIKPTIYSKLRRYISDYKRSEGTSYAKVLIQGNTGIYLASPTYLHSDYNKCRIFDKNEQTLKLMQIFNSLINK